jgi:hypothetical protein
MHFAQNSPSIPWSGMMELGRRTIFWLILAGEAREMVLFRDTHRMNRLGSKSCPPSGERGGILRHPGSTGCSVYQYRQSIGFCMKTKTGEP